jgi:hypothetical protein
MNIEKKVCYGRDSSNLPSRVGKIWDEEEIKKLLSSIQKKKSVEEIAKEHERTVGGIESCIRKLATDYHFNDNRSIEEIQKFTGLSKDEIELAIKRRDIAKATVRIRTKSNIVVSPSPVIIKPIEEEIPTMKEVVSLLKDIQTRLDRMELALPHPGNKAPILR